MLSRMKAWGWANQFCPPPSAEEKGKLMPAPQVVVIHGATGAIGSATARAFAKHGARLFLAGRRPDALASVAASIADAAGHAAHTAEVDAYDEAAVTAHADSIVAAEGRIDVMVNAVSIPLVQGTPLLEMKLDDVTAPIARWSHTQFITSRAAARHMVAQGSGTILTLSASPARMSIAGVGGFSASCAAIEALTRTFAAELGPSGVRVVCIRPQRIDDTIGNEADLPMPVAEFRTFLESLTTSASLPTLEEVAEAAVYLAQGGANTMNGAVLNLTCGMSVD